MADIAGSVDFHFRHPEVRDGLALWKLVGEVGVLDHNSTYAYLMVCRDFADTCIVAETDGRLQGFVTAYRPPTRPETIFVWQIGVAPEARGRRLAVRILDQLLLSPACDEVSFLETNVTPSNQSSRKMFHEFARRLEASVAESGGFDSSLFPDPSHEPERLLRIGPFPSRKEGR
jgi:L-2,4-diaminobutyric acid acetyltransferase